MDNTHICGDIEQGTGTRTTTGRYLYTHNREYRPYVNDMRRPSLLRMRPHKGVYRKMHRAVCKHNPVSVADTLQMIKTPHKYRHLWSAHRDTMVDIWIKIRFPYIQMCVQRGGVGPFFRTCPSTIGIPITNAPQNRITEGDRMARNPRAIDNLRTPTHEEAQEMARKSAEVRRAKAQQRKALRESLDVLLTKALKKGDLVKAEDIQDMANVENINIDVQTAMSIAIIQRALLGDVQAFQTIRDTIGEKPSDKVEVDQSLTIESWAKTHKVKL